MTPISSVLYKPRALWVWALMRYNYGDSCAIDLIELSLLVPSIAIAASYLLIKYITRALIILLLLLVLRRMSVYIIRAPYTRAYSAL